MKIIMWIFAGLALASLPLLAEAEKSFAGVRIVVLSASDGAPAERIISPWIPVFEQRTGIKVEFVEMGMGALHTKLAMLFATGSPEVDVIWTYAAWTAEFAAAGYLEDITDWLDEETLADLTGAKVAVTYKGRLYGLPKFGSMRFFYYNKKLFEEVGLDPEAPPATWEEFVVAAARLTRDTDGDGKIDQWGFLPSGLAEGENAVMDFQIMYLLCGGGPLLDENDEPLFSSPIGVEALTKYVELYDLGVVDPAAWTIVSGSDRRARWMLGKTGMVFEWPALWKQANDPTRSQVAGQVGITLIPSIYTTASLDGSEAHAISRFSKNKKAAFEFIKFVASPEVQRDIAIRIGWLPVRKSVYGDPAVKEHPQLAKMFEMAEAFSAGEYPIDRFAAPYAQEVMDRALYPALVSAVKHEKTPEEALQWAAEKAREIVQKYK